MNLKCKIINKLKSRSKDKKTLEQIEKKILSTLYVSQITGENPIKKILENNMISEEQISEKIEKLIQDNLVNQDKMTLTEIGRGSLRVVLAGGVFDIIHPGHISTLNAAKNIPGVNIMTVKELRITDLAPGTSPGRVTVWTESAVKSMEEWK